MTGGRSGGGRLARPCVRATFAAAFASVLVSSCQPHPGLREAARSAVPRVLRYETTLAIDVPARSIRGETSIRFEAPEAGTRELRFPLHDLVFDEVEVEGRKAPQRLDGGDLVVVLPRASRRGPESLLIRYHGTPAKGLLFGDRFVASTFDTCHWMPCSEGPGEKSEFRLRVSLPEGYRVVAGGRLVGSAPDGPGRVRFTVEEERPYSPYLFGFAAGEFTEASVSEGSTELRFAGIGVSQESLQLRFRETGRMLRFFEEKAGLPFPQSVYTQVLVPGSAAQEKSSFSILGQDEVDPILTNPKEDWAIAHELAHQWWGNLVTCRAWSELWLNEAVVTFLVAVWKEERWGREAYEREIALFSERHRRAIDAGFDVPLAYAGAYPSLRIRRAIQYSKGALFLDLLRKELGDAAFWRGLKAYTRANARRTVVSSDLQAALQQASGRDLGPLFRSWVYGSP